MSRASKRARGRQQELARQEPPVSAESLVGATKQIGALRLGLNENSIGIDATKLEAPPQAYDADVAWFEYRTGRLSLFFGKGLQGKDGALASSLEIRYPPEDFVNTFWGVSEPFFATLDSYARSWPDDARDVETPPDHPRVTNSHSEWVTFTYMSHSGTEASLDFYHLSPSAIAKFSQSRTIEGLRLRPVVRVQLTTFDLIAFIKGLRPIVEQILASLPEVHRHMLRRVDDNERPA